jgi:hypothetical protein
VSLGGTQRPPHFSVGKAIGEAPRRDSPVRPRERRQNDSTGGCPRPDQII